MIKRTALPSFLSLQNKITFGIIDTLTHNKTIQKEKEGFRISQVQKQYLKTSK